MIDRTRRIGEYYTEGFSDYSFICLVSSKSNDICLGTLPDGSVIDHFSMSGTNLSGDAGLIFRRVSTPEEIEWLDMCIKLYEELIKEGLVKDYE